MEPIAIIGTGCRFPGHATRPSKLWELLRAPPDLCGPMPEGRLNASGFYHEDSSYHGHTNVKNLRSYFLAEECPERRFDARFFGIGPSEANVMDPQARLLLETTYEALEAAGQTIERLRGSNTSCYVGLMLGDYEQAMIRDEATLGKYHVTGIARSLMSNRISYFFDWHGPSMTIDTACSSSLVAIHQAVQVLRSGSSRVAIAAGANLLLDPTYYIAESKLQMLSPDGYSKMWDADANGYARGEGVAAIVMKRLADAEADGDHIECVIRETGVNQDGRTNGITMPSPDAQSRLIGDCYQRAGLDLSVLEDRPQYFEAHGTGTPAGDPVEAEAIDRSFFGGNANSEIYGSLFVGSAKTVIGHSEGTAGLAAIIKTSLALQHSEIPPNLHFKRLNPQVEPFCSNLVVPTTVQPWPAVKAGQPRRASVNSFGFGGTNAHAILESYVPPHESFRATDSPGPRPFIFSAASSKSLCRQVSAYSEWIKQNTNHASLRDLAYTLQDRRSRLQRSLCITARTYEQLNARLEDVLENARDSPSGSVGILTNRDLEIRKPNILGIFTGQGAQWARMGAELVANSVLAREVVEQLEERLSRLPENDRPSWSLMDEIAKNTETSRIQEAELSQPLCVAIQIVLVRILRTTGIEFDAVVGHSSGEITAAYAAGVISAEDAICLAYYRGLYSRLSCGTQGQNGAMMAVGTSYNDIMDLCESEDFRGRISIAAHNSSSSFTIAGDEDAIEEIKTILDDEKKFSRRLKVDKAYHSYHMNQCVNKYLSSAQKLGIQVRQPEKRIWFSSAYQDDRATHGGSEVEGSYWNANMVLPVLFMQAVKRASGIIGRPDLVIEIGPHPALKGPVVQILQEEYGVEIPYTGLLQRGNSDLESIADGLGYARVHLGPSCVNMQAYEQYALGNVQACFVTGLPTYCWDHDAEYWHESRFAKAIRSRKDDAHSLLGHLTPDSTRQEMRWRNILRLNEIPWVEGHQIQNQIVFPAAGYVVLAIEASRKLAEGSDLQVIEIENLSIEQALVLEEDSNIETLFSLSHMRNSNGDSIKSDFKYYAAVGSCSSQLQIVASGTIEIGLGKPNATLLHPRRSPQSNLCEVKADDFYDYLLQIGYCYSDHFRTLGSLKRKLGAATGFIQTFTDSKMLVHPTLLDVAFQTVLLSHSAPYDGRIRGMHVPKTIRRITLNPYLCSHGLSTASAAQFDSTHSGHDLSILSGDVDIYSAASRHAMIQVEGLECVPFSSDNADEDVELFSSIIWDLASPDAQLNCQPGATEEQCNFIYVLERLAVYYLRELDSSIPKDHPSRNESDLRGIFGFASHIMSLVREGHFPCWKSEWDNDSLEAIFDCSEPHKDKIDFILLNEMGQNLDQIVKGNISALEIGMRDGLLAQFYKGGLGMAECSKQLAKVIKQITHRFPRMNIIEVGAGTGSATKSVFEEISSAFSSYTYTDVSSGFFDRAQSVFDSYSSRVLYKVLDISKSPQTQGFSDNSYDVVVASMVLHATPSLQETLRNVRRLLRPGGYLVAIEIVSNDVARAGAIFGAFPGWWLGAEDGRLLGPAATPVEWDRLLRSSGFSGCDSIASVVGEFSVVWVSQAVDDRVTFLRDPLIPAPETSKFKVGLNSFVVIGGEKLMTSKLVAQLQKLLRPYCTSDIQNVVKLDGSSPLILTPETTVLCLADLDKPLFQDLTDVNLETTKKILHGVRSVVWVTTGRRAQSPFANMTAGFMRCALQEIPELNFQLLDFDERDQIQGRVIAESVLRFIAQACWKNQTTPSSNLLMTAEPELVIGEDNKVLIPRLIPDSARNDRYNSFYRPIMSQRNLDECHIGLKTTEAGSIFLFEKVSIDQNSTALRATQSFLKSVNIPQLGFTFLSLCQGQADDETMFCLSVERGASITPLACVAMGCKLPTNLGAAFLFLVVMKLMIIGSLSCLTHGDVLLVHNPHPSFGTILERELGVRGIRTLITTDDMHSCNAEWIYIGRHTPSRAIQDCIPRQVSVLIDCNIPNGRSSAVAGLRSHITSTCKEMAIGDLMRDYAELRPGASNDITLSAVEVAVADALKEIRIGRHPMPTIQTLRPPDLNSVNCREGFSAVVDWDCNSSMPIRIQPIGSQPLFSNSKTYWLAGLSGGLGLSLCEWMISRGARYIVISSRRPNVDPNWLERMEARRATIKIYANDLTNKKQVLNLHEELCLSLPPIAGIAQGAMVLDDTSIRDMDKASFMMVTQPKVQGSIHLQEIFRDSPLDFFIFFSSLSSVFGNVGQANYSAANWFMVSLAEQRRQRGLAASVMHIGPILGVGYIAQAGMEVQRRFSRSPGFVFLSERDFHQQFAEAVVAGRLRSGLPMESITGLRKVQPGAESSEVWFSNPFLSHMILHDKAVDPTSKANHSKVPLKTRLQQASTSDQVHIMIEEDFVQKLCTLFRLDYEEIMKGDLRRLYLDELGIDSLLAVEIRTWWMKTLDVNIPVLKIMSGTSVRALIELGAAALDTMCVVDAVAEKLPSFVQSNENSTPASPLQSDFTINDETPLENSTLCSLPSSDTSELMSHKPFGGTSEELSFSQSLFWFASAFHGGTGLNHTGTFRLTGPLRSADLGKAFSALVNRHESLRTCFFLENGNPRRATLDTINSRQVCLENRRIDSESEVPAVTEEFQNYAFDLESGETMRAILLTLSSNMRFLLITTHSLVMDGFSGVILMKELLQLYNNQPVSQDILQYPRHARQQRENFLADQFDDELVFWKNLYSDIPAPLPILRVSNVVSRPTLHSYENERQDLRISNNTKRLIQSTCRRFKVTPFHFYLAVLRVLLVRYTGQSDISIGIGDANRIDESYMTSIGPFINILPLRFRTMTSSKFGDILAETRSETYSALENSRVPFQVLLNELEVPRSSTHTPIFQCFLDYRLGVQEKQRWGDVDMEMTSFQPSKSPYDLALDIIDNPDGDCLLMFVARSDLYRKCDIEIILKSYEILVKSLCRDPNICVTQVDIYSAEDVAQAYSLARGPSQTSLWSHNLVDRVDYIAQHNPSNPSVRFGIGGFITYSTLTTKSIKIAGALRSVGLGVGSTVAVFQEQTFSWVASILGILRIGAIYVPLDPSLPLKRLATIISDCQPQVILVDEDTKNNVFEICADSEKVMNLLSLPVTKPEVPVSVTNVENAMVLYTSGSSGTPKGIILKHEGLRNWIEQASSMCQLRDDEIVLQQSSSAFDMSITQIFLALCYGGSVYLLPRRLRGDAEAITNLIASEKITLTSATPSEYFSWLRYGSSRGLVQSPWRRAICAGEPVDNALLNLFDGLGKVNLLFYNSYGPTEISLVATAVEIPIGEGSHVFRGNIPAGYPLPNYSVYVLGDDLKPVPIGVQGEIYIGGAGVAAGYLHNEALTCEKFVVDPFASSEYHSKGWTIMHRTGDLGRWQQDGAILIEGRISGDTQIKLRGQRINLREVELAITKASDGLVGEAVVSVRFEPAPDSSVLVAHIKLEPGHTQEQKLECLATLRSKLELPLYMHPGAIIVLDELPVTSSGKLDRRAVASMPLPPDTQLRSDYSVELKDTEAQLSTLWKDILSKDITKLHYIGPETDFFHVGGTSLLLLSLQERIRSVFGLRLGIVELFESSTLCEMSQRILKEDTTTENFDWEAETQLSPATLSYSPPQPFFQASTPKTIILTGATGFLGQGLVRALSEVSRIEKIHCICVRDEAKGKQLLNLPKVVVHYGDLTFPRLGLSDDDAKAIFGAADCIIHNGADVSHLKAFRSLRLANLVATKQLIEMSLHRKIPMHYISTGGVCAYSGLEEFPEISALPYPPPPDAFDGYTASKWASECYLEKVHLYCDWPIWIHRPSSIIRDDIPELDLMQNLVKYSRALRAVPILPKLRGMLDLVSRDSVVQSVVERIGGLYSGRVQFVHVESSIQVELDNIRDFVGADIQCPIEELSPAAWAERAQAEGLHPILVAFFGEHINQMQKEVIYPRLVH
ncbi:hypothetical protein E0Z10_g2470 [Xylaria hypoxylon]|uniref:Carrier domain-containing protein n=1 Tax=Xylaria hypoxylon TaxID=37992 RepID=A0A4Z0Z3P4_9PEZI|nr:hypothetical protein E0Z10_g2470 [Xylaria hypoxylon]